MIEFDNLTYLHGKPQGTGLLKANPEDFVVVVVDLLQPTIMHTNKRPISVDISKKRLISFLVG